MGFVSDFFGDVLGAGADLLGLGGGRLPSAPPPVLITKAPKPKALPKITNPGVQFRREAEKRKRAFSAATRGGTLVTDPTKGDDRASVARVLLTGE